jgi:hypothetical protein
MLQLPDTSYSKLSCFVLFLSIRLDNLSVASDPRLRVIDTWDLGQLHNQKLRETLSFYMTGDMKNRKQIIFI